MIDQLKEIQQAFTTAAAQAQTAEQIEALRVEFLGRKAGRLNEVLRTVKTLPPEERKTVGAAANAVRLEIEEKLETFLRAAQSSGASDVPAQDLTLPGLPPRMGHVHPLTQVFDELMSIFTSMGFMVYEGPELENDFYNFEALNFPQDHPARDIQDTFFIKTPITRAEKHSFPTDRGWVMRTHTSNMQVRVMEEFQPPLRCIIPGRAFRNEATDASHEFTLYQMEGFIVDTDITIGHLFWTLRELFQQLYKKPVKIRLRPGYFPFTEPSYEVDMSCLFCEQKGCRVCKQTGWLEMGGSGMIHPNVFKAAGYQAGKYTGFAFGMGPMRLAMLKYGIPDIRLFMENDTRFLEQF
ncbi:MAG: phenylalanine--tRNA ligase subunit alpha [Candidatus Kerfeldbacteria bacterium]|nr:phenylalanine--tRNA ligase subunit alpha [Candidatus Kerfeldbacteria bacterium]